MKIASITPSFNEGYQLRQWEIFYKEYRDEIYLHIIVDNGSNPAYLEEIKRFFKNSVIIERSNNGGNTAAFNDGIKYALEHGADSILLITQDIRILGGSIVKLYNLLYSASDIGVVGPILMRGDETDTIEEYGSKVDLKTMINSKYYIGHTLNNRLPEQIDVDFVAGGINLSKAEAYKKAGLFDESLFMYYDEQDWDIRVKKSGLRLLVTKSAQAWHHHNYRSKKNIRQPFAIYLLYRNQMVLLRKFTTTGNMLRVGCCLLIQLPRQTWRLLIRRYFRHFLAHYLGVFCGLLGMKYIYGLKR
jgi:GT2 family glycosyltransferase